MTQKRDIAFRNQVGPPIKRKRIVMSCSQCRKKKIKCDKQRPVCGVCVKSQLHQSCTYQEPSWEDESMKLSSSYESAASIPMAHIKVEKPKIQLKQDPLITKDSPIPTGVSPYNDSHQQHPIKNSNFGTTYSSVAPIESVNSTPTPPSSTTTPNVNNYQQGVRSQYNPPFGRSAPGFSEELYKLREKVEFLESNMRREPNSINPVSLPPINANNLPRPNLNNYHSHNNVTSSEPSPSSHPQRDQHFMSFYDFQEPVQVRAGRLIASGPLSIFSIIKKDPFLRVCLLKIRKEKNTFPYPWKKKVVKSSELVKEIVLQDKNSKNKRVDEHFTAKLIENEGLDEIKTGQNRDEPQMVDRDKKIDYETETIMKIEDVLPEEKLVWILVDRFFNSILSAFLPFLSEALLREKIQDIIGPREDAKRKIKNITISTRFDFAYMGQLLILLRLTYLSVGKTPNNTLQEQYILKNRIGLNVVNVAQMCLNQFRLLRRGALPIIQCCLFMRFYHKFAPEDGDGNDGGDSQVFLGMLLQMANSIGLNRDLSNSTLLKSNYRLANMWRMIWHEIVSLDLHQSLIMGTPILVNEAYFDTKLPILEAKVEDRTLKNFDIHTAVIENFQITAEINQYARDILTDILDISKMVDVNLLKPKLLKLETFVSQNFKSLDDVLNLKNYTIQDMISKVYKFINYIELKASLYIIYFQIYLSRPEKSYAILLKLLNIAMEILPLSYLLITANNEKTNYFDSIFGSGSQLLVIPSMLISLQKIHQIVAAMISRCLDMKYNHPENPHQSIISKIRDELIRKLGITKDGYQSLSSNYYHAWRTSKGVTYIYNTLTNEDDNIWDKTSAMNQKVSKEEVNEEVNYLKIMPVYNELNEMSESQLNEILDTVRDAKYEESLMSWLNKKKKHGKSQSQSNNGMTKSHNNGFNHVRTNHYDNFGSIPQNGDLTGSSLVSNGNESYTRYGSKKSSIGDETSSRSLLSTTTDRSTKPGGITSSSTATTTPTKSNDSSLMNEFHVNKNAMTNSEIDRLWFQVMASNTMSNLHGADEAVLRNADQTLMNAENNHGELNQIDNFDALTHGGAGAGTNGENGDRNSIFNDIEETVSSLTFLDGTFGAFGTLDLEKLVGDTSPYDMFGDNTIL